MNSFVAACFDLDGTLIDTESIHLKAEGGCLKFFGIDASDHRRPRTFGLGIETGMRSLADAFGLDLPSVLSIYMPLWEEGLQSNLRLLPGVSSVLSWLLEHNIPLALVTSSDGAYVDLVDSILDLKQAFQVVVTSDNVIRLKPDPLAYLEAVKQLEVDPEACIGFEDSGVGISALNAAGLFSVAVHPALESRPELQIAELGVRGLAEIPSYLMSWFGN